MIYSADASLHALLTECLPPGVSVVFNRPVPVAGTPTGRFLHLFLYDIREDPRGRLADWLDVRDGTGRVVGRQRPPRRYELSYLASAVCGEVDDEHRLLGEALGCLHEHEFVPARLLGGDLAGAGRVNLTVAGPRPVSETGALWTAMGAPLRASFDVTLTVTVPAARTAGVAPAPDGVNLGLSASN